VCLPGFDSEGWRERIQVKDRLCVPARAVITSRISASSSELAVLHILIYFLFLPAAFAGGASSPAALMVVFFPELLNNTT